MQYLKQIFSISILLVLTMIYSISNENKITSKDIEIKRDTEDILDTTLDIKDKITNLKTTKINGKIINYGDNATIKYIEKQIKNTHIHKKYFTNINKCSQNCGIAIKSWNDAKNYCYIRGGKLPSKSDIEHSNKYNKEECSDCSYWTSTEAKRDNGKSYPHKKIYVYDQAENIFLKFSLDSTYLATCLAN